MSSTATTRLFADGDVDDLALLEEEGVDTLVGSEQGVDVEAEVAGDDEEGVALLDGVGGGAALDAGGGAGLGQAGGVVGVADVGGDLEDLAEEDEVGVLEAVELGDVADAGAQLLRDDGEGVAGDNGVVDDGALGAGGGGGSGGRGGARGGDLGGSSLLYRLLARMVLGVCVVCGCVVEESSKR